MWQVFEYDDFSEEVTYVGCAPARGDAEAIADDRYADVWRDYRKSVVAVDFEAMQATTWGVNPFGGEWDEVAMPEAVKFGPWSIRRGLTLHDLAPALNEVVRVIGSAGISLRQVNT